MFAHIPGSHFPGGLRIHRPPTLGAKLEIRFPRSAAVRAGLLSERPAVRLPPAGLIITRPADLTAQERLAPLNRKKRDEEQAEVMVDSLETERGSAAVRAYPDLFVESPCSWSDADDEEKH